jgi:hypothetical protein
VLKFYDRIRDCVNGVGRRVKAKRKVYSLTIESDLESLAHLIDRDEYWWYRVVLSTY